MVGIPEINPIKPNFNEVRINGFRFFFSYKTLVAVKKGNKLLISENQWGNTTGRHLNEIDPDKKKRIPHNEFLNKVRALK